MPQVLVPGAAEFRIKGAVGAGVWNVILHYFGSPPGGAYTIAQLQSMVTGFANTNFTAALSFWPSTTTLTEIVATDIGVTNPAVYTGSPGFVGTGTAEQDAASCVLINLGTTIRERGGKPRVYLPGMESLAQSSPNTWNTTSLGTFAGVFETAMLNAASGGAAAGVAGCAQAAPLYNYTYTDVPSKHKYLKTRESLKAVAIVQSRSANPKITTQRRRLRAA